MVRPPFGARREKRGCSSGRSGWWAHSSGSPRPRRPRMVPEPPRAPDPRDHEAPSLQPAGPGTDRRSPHHCTAGDRAHAPPHPRGERPAEAAMVHACALGLRPRPRAGRPRGGPRHGPGDPRLAAGPGGRPEEHEDGIFPLAQEYDSAVSGFLRETLLDRLQTTDRATLARAMEVFMGMKAPHAWPIKMPELQQLGLPAQAAAPEWARFVDMYRHRLAPP